MTVGIVGRKSGMTRVFTEDGISVPVTVVEVVPNRVTQIKEQDTDGYRAIQVTTGNRKASKVSKPEAGHFAAAGVEAGTGLWEFRLDGSDEAFEVGAELTVARFEQGQKVDVVGQSKGKGFQGAIKRWNFRTQDATHGNSLSHRAPGSLGQCQTPGRVFKGKKMAGHMGDARVTVQNLMVVSTDLEKGIILLKGAVPGAKGSYVLIKDAVKDDVPDEAPFPGSIKTKSVEDTAAQPDDEGAVSSELISGSPDEASEAGNNDINAASQDAGDSGGADAEPDEKKDDGDEVSS